MGDQPLQKFGINLKKIEERPDVAWVRVALHGDTEVGERNGAIVYDIAGDTILICTTANIADIEQTADCKKLCSDGVYKTYDSAWYTEIPSIPEEYQVLTLWWD